MKNLIIWLLLLFMSFTANAQLIGGGPRKPKVGGSSGTVTSVGLSAPTGLTVSGSPVTGAGTLGLSLASGYSIPTTANQANWTTAYEWGNHAGLYASLSGSYSDPAWLTLSKSKVGLGNVDNTSDLNKPVSTATQAALDLKANSSALSNYALLGGANTFTLSQSFTAPWANYQASFGGLNQGGNIGFSRGSDGLIGLRVGMSSANGTAGEMLSNGQLQFISAGFTRFYTAGAETLRLFTNGNFRFGSSGIDNGFKGQIEGSLSVEGNQHIGGTLTLNDGTISKGTGGSFVFPAALSVSGSVVASGSFSLFGGGTTENSAVITVNSTTKGILPPRMTSSHRTAISSPATGLILYQTDGTEGIWVNTSTGWKQLAFLP